MIALGGTNRGRSRDVMTLLLAVFSSYRKDVPDFLTPRARAKLAAAVAVAEELEQLEQAGRHRHGR